MHHRLAVVLVLVALVLPACTGTDTTLTVLAASSLADAFDAVAQDFEADHPGVDVRVSAAGSQQLATQVLEGAPADVFASADQAQMSRVVDARLATDPAVFAHNELAIAVAPGAPPIGSLGDLAAPDVRVVLAAPEVPAGHYAREVLDAAGVRVDPISLEPNVRAVLSKVSLGEADAGIVYRSDLVAVDTDASAVAIPPGQNVVADYSVAALADAPRPDLAEAFVEHLLGASAQARLVAAGFTVDAPS